MIDVQFPTALQIMLRLALAHREGVATLSSTQLAKGVVSTPSFVRKMVAQLSKSGLVASSMGTSGGIRLSRPAAEIKLDEIYRSVIGYKGLWHARQGIPKECVVSSHMDEYFAMISWEAEAAALQKLSTRTLAQSLAEMQSMDDKRKVQKRTRTSPPNKGASHVSG